ncbi:MAG: MCE family protein [Actinomycetota bacterium]|nr:MCE family protein [Actinomycetota bacterium]
MIGWRIKVNLVAFLIFSLGLVYAMATQVLSVLEPRYSVYAIFPDAGGVFTNQEVTYRGLTVGRVGTMEVVEEGVKIELSIEKTYDQIPKEDIEARVMFKSAVGEQFVDLLPAVDGEPFLAHGDEIPKEQNTIPVSTQELLSTLEAVLRGVPPEALKGAVDALGVGLTGHGPDIATIIESTADLAELFAEKAPEVQGLLRNGSKVGEAFVASRADFARAIEGLVEVSEELSQDRDALKRLLTNTNFTSDEVVSLLETYDRNVDRFLPQFAELNDLQAEHADDLSQIFQFLPTGLDRIARAFEPSTGLVRFGAIGEPASASCSYGTDRRRPTARTKRLPPKNARCANNIDGSRSSGDASSGGSGASAAAAAVTQVLAEEAETSALPQRMDDWSWTLFYLNSM